MKPLKYYERVLLPAELCISDMERNGIMFDYLECQRASIRLHKDILGLTAQLNEWAGYELNYNSWQQLYELLFEVKGLPIAPIAGPPTKLTKGKPSTSRESLEWIYEQTGDQGIELLMKYKQWMKLVGYVDKMPQLARQGRIHPQLQPTTLTGRLTCRNPNLQQQPPYMRKMFVAAPGRLLVCMDFSGLEWRILAHITAKLFGDHKLVNEVRAGIDPHSSTAKDVWKLEPAVEDIKKEMPEARNNAKGINYGLNYGKGEVGLGVTLKENGVPIGTDRAKEVIRKFFEARPGIAKYHN